MTRVCVYTRISTDEENQPTSLASQHERLEAFCKVQEDWRIIAHHEDRATGTKLDRPGLQAALDLARQGRIDQLLVYRIDRLSRKVRQLASIAEELDTLNVVLRSATEPFDTGSPAGRMMLQMLGVFAEFEHATIVDRITAGIERRAREGRWYSGRPPFGYTLNDGQLAPDPITAPTVRRIYQLYIEDRLGTIAIAHQLRAEHAPAPSAGWGHPAVHRVLTNPTYLGRIRWRDQDFLSTHEPTDRAEHLRSGTGDPHRARRGRLPPTRQPLGLPALRRRPLRTLRPRLHRHVSTRQRRPLPLLRLHRPPKVRPQSLPRPARLPREARDRRPAPTHRHLPRRTTHPRRTRHRPTTSRTRATRARRTPPSDRRRDHPHRTLNRPLLRRLRGRPPLPRALRATPRRPHHPPRRPPRPTSRANRQRRRSRAHAHNSRSRSQSPTGSTRSSSKASPSRPRRSCASSSPSYASTARPASSRPTASSRQGFAQRPKKWTGAVPGRT